MTFDDLHVLHELTEALAQNGIKEPTPVQEQAIPVVRSGSDAIVQSQTGTGKTLAFLLPMLEKIKTGADAVQALVVTPTRELAQQIAKVASLISGETDVRSLLICGGQDIERQKERLGRHPHLIIGTPGRLLDHLRHHSVDFSHVNRIVLDEADEMLRMGFIGDVEQLLASIAGDHQLLLFSATMPDCIKGLAHRYMERPASINIASEHITLDSIEQVTVDVTDETKLDTLCELVNKYRPYLAMIFCHTRKRAAWLAMELSRRGYMADALHGDMTQAERNRVLSMFRDAKLQLLVTTDIAARGLDIEGVTHVFNYDLPQDAEWYIHRIGRTGRAGETGMAITFVTPRQYSRLRQIENAIKKNLDKKKTRRSPKQRAQLHAREAAEKPTVGKAKAKVSKFSADKKIRRNKKSSHSNPHTKRPVQKKHVHSKSNLGHRARRH